MNNKYTRRQFAYEITKKQVVCSELWRALHLFVVEHDFVSAHVLAGASSDIILSTLENSDRKTRKSSFIEKFGKEEAKLIHDSINREYNFFKHGSKRPSDSIDSYFPTQTELFLLESCHGIHDLFEEAYLETLLYIYWYNVRYLEKSPPNNPWKPSETDGLFKQLGNAGDKDFYIATRGLANCFRDIEFKRHPSGYILLKDQGFILSEKHVTKI